jgi:hypothetical protein
MRVQMLHIFLVKKVMVLNKMSKTNIKASSRVEKENKKYSSSLIIPGLAS